MDLAIKHMIVCDEVRREDNGKRIIIGVYTNTILVPEFPFVLPSLTFFSFARASESGDFPFEASLLLPQQDEPSTKAQGRMQIREIGDVQYTLQFRNVKFKGPGICRLGVRIGEHEEIVAAEISVQLRTKDGQTSNQTITLPASPGED